MKPFVISMHHRCGSTWTAQILTSVFRELKITITAIFTNRESSQHNFPGYCNYSEVKTATAFIGNCNYKYLPEGTKGINIYRDPRDQVVSGYFSHLYSHPTNHWPELIPYRERLKNISKERGIQEEMEFSRDFIEDLGSFDLDDGNFEHFNLMDIGKYKDSVLFFVMSTLFRYGRFSFTRKESIFLGDLAKDSTFIKFSGGRKPGQTDEKHHFRNGKEGDWKNHFSENNKDQFKEKYNYILLKYGFEKDLNW